ncbi:hypothetical protein NDU88_001900 [Pleurodeles waltl]|uniref:Uncharacterized protein n=1 Tax=Pleurodeles waltl TaxID=8319 RepID=A0AAV7MMT8_PLEWA|nr:hypothetical protein NDU88_001900 [Pleurodeles waltl]
MVVVQMQEEIFNSSVTIHRAVCHQIGSTDVCSAHPCAGSLQQQEVGERLLIDKGCTALPEMEHKAPGSEGLPAELYTTSQTRLAACFLCNECHFTGENYPTQWYFRGRGEARRSLLLPLVPPQPGLQNIALRAGELTARPPTGLRPHESKQVYPARSSFGNVQRLFTVMGVEGPQIGYHMAGSLDVEKALSWICLDMALERRASAQGSGAG